jgi:2-polyprenyl-6-hydroxyphenyl methylase/3-demethylubiquinone-9 3-methyltransferase
MEHVHDTRAAFVNLAHAMAPGATMAHFIPCRNAPFAILNRMLGNKLSRTLLFTLKPNKKATSGFPAYYRDCTPSRIARICGECSLEVVELVPYFRSEYASFFAPIYTVDLIRQLLLIWLDIPDLAETFTVVARAPR